MVAPCNCFFGLGTACNDVMGICPEELHLKSKQRLWYRMSRSRDHQAQIPLTLNEVQAFISFTELGGPFGPARG